jgi:hypothetical protein
MALQQGNWLRVPCLSRCDSSNPPIPFPSSWGEYFTLKLHDFELPFQLLQLPPVVSQLTDCMSSILTAVHGLKLLGLDSESTTPPVDADEEADTRFVITLHFLGAEMYDMMGLDAAVEEILHWVPDCTVLDIALVGPELPVAPQDAGIRQRVCRGMCEKCAEKGCEVYLTCVNKTYHDALEEGSIIEPTLAVCANSGLHEQPALAKAWAPTIRKLFDLRIPTVFTAYTEGEIAADMRQVQHVCDRYEQGAPEAMFRVQPTRNPFRGLLPMSDTYCDSEFFYCNNFYMIMINSS